MYNDILVILTLIVMEGVLSIDNAAVLATMVKHLPPNQQKNALRYGLLGAYLFRWVALALATFIVKFAIFKLAGGLYLAYLAISHFVAIGKNEEGASSSTVTRGFWATVAVVEMMDMVFSLDNILAAVALSPKLWIVITGVFIGILAMRFVAGGFIRLMEKYPQLENSAYAVIGILGGKLILDVLFKFIGFDAGAEFITSHVASAITSLLTVILFGYPILQSYLKK